MNDLEVRRYEMFKRVRDFGATHAASFPANTLGGELFATIGAVVTELDGHAAAQSSGGSSARQSTATKAVARAALREDLEAIRRTARSMALDSPGLDNKFRLPRNANDQVLLSTARAFAADAVPLTTEFVRHEMPSDFLADLNADIADFERAVNGQNLGIDTRVTATAAIDAAIERGMQAARRLDAVVRNKFSNDPARRAAWESARHTERLPRSGDGARNQVAPPQ